MGKLASVLACLALLAGTKSMAAAQPPLSLIKATEGYTYFNRPAATKAEYERDFYDCMSLAVSLVPEGKVSEDGKVSGKLNPMYSGVLLQYWADASHRARSQTNLENCMVLRRWRLVRLDVTQGAESWALAREALAPRLEDWRTAAQPPGDVARSFENDAARRDVVMMGTPSPIGQPSLYLLDMKLLDPARLKTLPAPSLFHYAGINSKVYSRPLASDQLKSMPADAAVVVLMTSGKAEKCGDCLGFQRVGSTPGAVAFDEDGQADLMEFANRFLKPTVSNATSKTYVFALPPGAWRVQARAMVELCLGAPSFTLKPGEVLYLGHFDLDAEVLRPDMAVDRVKPLLAGSPDLADRIQPAGWTNGATWPCHNLFSVYALEFEGFPFGRARPAAPRATRPASPGNPSPRP